MPPGVLAKLNRFEVRGFETTAEQIRAAKVYMDRRGIARPSTPWLAPEFVNPLFLRSACIALNQDKKTEFPRGLTGTKAILAFYLRSVARNLGAGRGKKGCAGIQEESARKQKKAFTPASTTVNGRSSGHQNLGLREVAATFSPWPSDLQITQRVEVTFAPGRNRPATMSAIRSLLVVSGPGSKMSRNHQEPT